MTGRGHQVVPSREHLTGAFVGGEGWCRLRYQHHSHHLHQRQSFVRGGDVGLATTAGSTAVLAHQRSLPSSEGSSSSSSKTPSFVYESRSPEVYSCQFSPRAPSIPGVSKDNEIGCSDLSLLNPLTEESILNNLSARYNKDQIYTYLGSNLVMMNPYKTVGNCTSEVIHKYHSSFSFQLQPHIYALANSVHRGVYERSTDQVVVAVGESGSGKTKTLNKILQYLSETAPVTSSFAKHRLLQSIIILETFGNAKTSRNDNSSRFAKYVEVEFDFKGEPIGGTISCYLLEKFRVTCVPSSEKNFHIFYQLLSGTDAQTLMYPKSSVVMCSKLDWDFLDTLFKEPFFSTEFLRLQRNFENYSILKSERHFPKDQRDVRKEYLTTKRALDSLEISSNEQLDAFTAVAIVLKIGNLSFAPINNIDGTEGCAVENEFELYEIAELLHCEAKALARALQTRTVEVAEDIVAIELSAVEAAKGRDALCRTIYYRLFLLLVSKINDAIKIKSRSRKRVLSLVDIQGFENTETNRFEQFVINFCNEKFHQVITTRTLKEEQEDYIREGLGWRHIEYEANYSTVEILEVNKTGIWSIIEDVTAKRRSGGDLDRADDEILANFIQMCGSHPNLEVKAASHSYCDNNLPVDAFRIRHFAGPVTYCIKGFAEKNTDCLTRDLNLLMFQCDHPLLKTTFPEGNPLRSSFKKPCSVVNQVQTSVGALLRTLQSKALNVVYCLRPNDLKRAGTVDAAISSFQIKYLDLLEQSRLAHNGWVYSCLHEVFLERYKMVGFHTWPSWKGALVEGCSLILSSVAIPSSQYKFGKSKIFIKSQKSIEELEHYRRQRLDDLADEIQKRWKRFRMNRILKRMDSAKISLPHPYEVRRDVHGLIHVRKEDFASRIIQCAYVKYQKYRLIQHLIECPPNESPISLEWPLVPLVILEFSAILQRLHHRWRCLRYRLRFDQTERNRMREKVTASILFMGKKKEAYYKSVGHPFIGDYLRLRKNPQWRRVCAQSNDQYLVFADLVNKIARSSGKFIPILLVLSTNSLLILDQRTLEVKYRILASDIIRITLSPYSGYFSPEDHIAVVHVRPPSPMSELPESQTNPSCLLGSDDVTRKGDLVLETGHIIEIVTKLFLVVQNAIGIAPEIAIRTEFEANFGQSVVVFSFKMPDPAKEIVANQIRIIRKQNKMEVML